MTDSGRRTKSSDESKMPTGYRSSRRGSKSLKQAKRAEKADKLVTGWNRAFSTVRNIGYIIAVGLAGLLAIVIVLLLAASLINGIARWSAARKASSGTPVVTEQAQENLLIIGEANGEAVGFLAMRVDATGKQAFGIEIPDGAFIEVPGQGFERVGESYSAGATASLTAISNYLTVPFKSYVVLPSGAYTELLKSQEVGEIGGAITASNLNDEQRARLSATLSSIPAKSAAFVPLPVRPIKLGNQTYYEPQRSEVADLLKAWWGVDPNKAAQVTRVIVYNGAGKPGIAGDAAQVLIRAGFRVVDTKNADRFDYKTTIVVVQRGPVQKGQQAVEALGTGIVKEKRSDEDVSDLIVIVGRDFKVPQ